jgi:hypothetical protein
MAKATTLVGFDDHWRWKYRSTLSLPSVSKVEN